MMYSIVENVSAPRESIFCICTASQLQYMAKSRKKKIDKSDYKPSISLNNLDMKKKMKLRRKDNNWEIIANEWLRFFFDE